MGDSWGGCRAGGCEWGGVLGWEVANTGESMSEEESVGGEVGSTMKTMVK